MERTNSSSRSRKNDSNAVMTMLAGMGQKKSGRNLKPREAYERLYYASKIKQVVDRKAAEHAPGLSKGKLLQLKNQVAGELWQVESTEVKEEVAAYIEKDKADKAAVAAAMKAGDGGSNRSPEDYQV